MITAERGPPETKALQKARKRYLVTVGMIGQSGLTTAVHRHGGFGPLSMARLKTLQVVAVPYVRTYTYVPRQFHLHFAFVMS